MESEHYSSSLQPEDVLGEGTYGTVFKGYTKDKENTPVALKQIRNDNRVFKESAKSDLTALQAVSGHKNIVRLLAFHTDNHFIYIIMELCSGDLEQYLSKGIPSYKVKLEIMKQCARGVNYIHSLDPPVVHRDIKTQNILLQELYSGIRIKIADFGLAKVFDKIGSTVKSMIMTTNIGSMAFRAPELWKNIDQLQYTAKIDNYALGLVFSILLNFGEDETSLEPYIADIPREPYLALGMGQLSAYNSNKPLPRLFFTPAVEENHRRMKSLIEEMITFDANERMENQTVKASIKNEMLRLNEEETRKQCEVEFTEQIEALKVKHDQDIATLKWNHDTELKDECEALQKTHQNEMERKTRLEIENIEITTELQKKFEKETLQHEDKYSALKENYERELQTKSKLESDITMHQIGNSRLQGELAALQKQHEQEEKARKIIETENDTIKAELKEECEALKKTHQKDMETKTRLENKTIEITTDNSRLLEEFAALQKQHKQEEKARKILETENDTIQKEYQDLQKKYISSSQHPGSFRRTDLSLQKIKGFTWLQSFNIRSECKRFSFNSTSNVFYFPHPDDNCISCYTTTGKFVKSISLAKYKIDCPRSVHPLTGDTVLVAAKSGLYVVDTGEGEGVCYCVHKGDCKDVHMSEGVVAVLVAEHSWFGNNDKVYFYDTSDLSTVKSTFNLTHKMEFGFINTILISNDVIYVCSTYYDNITQYSVTTGKMITQYGRRGREAPCNLHYPHLSVCDTEGSLLVVDSNNHCLQTLTARGEWAVLPGLGEVRWPLDAVIIGDKMYILYGLFDKNIQVFKKTYK